MLSTWLFAAEQGNLTRPRVLRMTVIIILLIVGVAALSVLLACLRGFSRAQKQERVVGLLMRAQDASTVSQHLNGRQPLEIPNNPRLVSDTTPAQSRISKNTAALGKLAIVLGSRSASSNGPARTLLMPDRDGKTGGAKKRARGI